MADPDPPPVLTLLVEKGPRKGQSLQRRAGAVLRVGRVVKGNDLAVGDAGASQRHLDLTFLPPPAFRWAATDLGSSNGTLLNGAALVPTIPAPLTHGDRIKIGESTVLAVSIAADAGPEPAATRRSTRHAAAVEEENEPPAVRRGRRKVPAAAADHPEAVKVEGEVATRRGGRKKAPAVADPPEEEKEEAAVVTRRGRRKKAVERPEAENEEEEEEEEEVLPQPKPQPQTRRSTRAAARRAKAVGTGQCKGEGAQTGRGRGRVTRHSVRKAKEAIHEEGAGGVAVLEEQKGTAAKSDREKDDKVENRDETSNVLAVEVQVALSVQAERTRKGRGRVRESTRKAKNPVIEEDAEKEGGDGDVVGARECMVNPPQVTAAKGSNRKEDEGTTESGEADGASKAEADQVMEEGDAPLAPRGQTQRSPDRRADTKGASADRDEGKKESGREEGSSTDQERREKMVPESKRDGVGEAGEDGKREVNGGRGEEGCVKNVSKCPEGCSLDNMALREWFVQIEEYMLAKNHEAAEKAIAEVEEKDRRFAEYIKTLK